MKNNITYLYKTPILKSILGYLLIILGILGLLNFSFYGAIILGLGILFIHKTGMELDLEFKRYRILFSVFGIKIGTWKLLNNVDYISLFKTTKKTRVRGITSEAHQVEKIYKLQFFKTDNQKLEIYITHQKEEAFKIAYKLSEAFKIPILDASEREQKWINEDIFS